MFMLVAISLDVVYNLTDNSQDTISYIANVSELLGLTIALTEILVLRKLTDKIKTSIANFYSYSDISDVSIFLSQTKDDLIYEKYGKAMIRLEKVRDVYHENLPDNELSNIKSPHRMNYDRLNSMISKLTMADSGGKIPRSELFDFVAFLTTFHETLLSLKLTFKKSIL